MLPPRTSGNRSSTSCQLHQGMESAKWPLRCSAVVGVLFADGLQFLSFQNANDVNPELPPLIGYLFDENISKL